MSAVPPKTLEWLYRVVTSNRHDPGQAYADPNRTYNDIAHTLSQNPQFSPRTDVYTYENGVSALLLHVSGTLPVTFRGAVYQFPITIWVPHGYPREGPMVYVTPTQDMLVRPGQHVSGDGRVYHHYLAHWSEAADRSTIVDLMYILRDIFAKEPPVISKQVQQQQNARQPPQSQATETPPAVPPLPPELARPSASQTPQVEQQQQGQAPPQVPPKPPPKPEGSPRVEASGNGPAPQERYQKPPPVPPLPSDYQRQHQPTYHERVYSQGQNVPPHQPQVPSGLRRLASPTHLSEPGTGTSNGTYSQDMRSPVSPIVEPDEPAQAARQSAAYQPHPHPQPQPQSQPPYDRGQYTQPQPQGRQEAPPQYYTQTQPFHPGYQAQPPQHGFPRPMQPHQAPAPAPVPAPQPKKAATPDLLTSPFDLELPDPTSSSAPPPPIPPNPEKDALLQNLSSTLTQTLQASVEKTNSGLQPLHSQSKALQNAMATLQSEISALNNIQTTLQSNVSILQHSLQQADGVIADAQARLASSSEPSSSVADGTSAGKPAAGPPPIDEVLVAPTVVGKQVYDLVADERGIQRALYALHVGLVKGRVGVDTWARHTRGLAREAFLKKALIRKAGQGMGLNVEEAV